MLQLFFAVAFSAVPLTLYVPPIRSFNLFIETIEEFLRQFSLYTVTAYPRLRLAVSRIYSNLIRLSRRSLAPLTGAAFAETLLIENVHKYSFVREFCRGQWNNRWAKWALSLSIAIHSISIA